MARFRLSSWPNVLMALRLRTFLVMLVFVALILTLIVQERKATERERRLRIELLQTRTRVWADDRMRDLFGDLGIVILKDAERVEFLRVDAMRRNDAYGATSTGKVLDKATADRLAGILLDRNLYSYPNMDDLPEPEVGFRFWRGQESLDVLIMRSGGGPNLVHQDVWAFVKNPKGEVVHGRGYPVCIGDAALEQLINKVNGP